MSILQKLSEIQNEVKCPKGQVNTFGNYKYRSCEDIMEALKPVCEKRGAVVYVSDELIPGERFYIKATASLADTETGEMVSSTAYAREAAEKKGMDVSQITGTASSYARKYALAGLFQLDDTKDADTDSYKEQERKGMGEVAKGKYPVNVPTAKLEDYINQIQGIAQEKGITPSALEASLNKHFGKGLNGLNVSEAKKAIELMKTPAKVTVNEIPG